MAHKLAFKVAGIPATFKNNKQIFVKKGKPIVTSDPKLARNKDRIAFAAREILPSDFKLIDVEFTLNIWVYANNKKADIDGIATTVLDALQLVCYTNDKLCSTLYVTRAIIETAPFIQIQIIYGEPEHE